MVGTAPESVREEGSRFSSHKAIPRNLVITYLRPSLVTPIWSLLRLCPSYPQKLLVPVWITDKELENVASFRSWKRIPVVVYRHLRNGAAIARCSQPEISWWGWRNADDEYLVTSIAKACALDPGIRANGGSLSIGNNDTSEACDADFGKV
ncbi:Myotubularin- protein 4 [Saguinus oedipus]|uniref:Myotubularin- protein 4 n=1 Tax=Saguinus oedipus TaxID=9490 RepID=A0ABQ9VPK0_SAGOE|nr:Myotubularin- protein 4 [Saguinus oedipus]